MAAPVIVRTFGATAKHLTLDIGEPQILREMTEGDGQEWHYFVAVRLKPGMWVTVDADGEIAADDLGGIAVIPLLRKAEFPAAERPFRCHGKHTPAQLASFRERELGLWQSSSMHRRWLRSRRRLHLRRLGYSAIRHTPVLGRRCRPVLRRMLLGL